ncbi:lipid II flippase MurJ [Collinsella sp. An2]|nr:lipid II flippase MurJ [Collinsella sp. An2]
MAAHAGHAAPAAETSAPHGMAPDEPAGQTGRLAVEGDAAPAARTDALAHDADTDATARTSRADEASDDDFEAAGDYESVGRSAGLMTLLIVISRLTGFARTWFMGIAFGVSLLASSYNIANNLPNMLYELVMGGMLVTAFLPVYMDARRLGGKEGANDYVGNLLSILLVVLGVASVAACIFAPGLIWTQSFMSDGAEMETAVYFFRIFAFQILFYGLGSVFSGVLNAHRDYFWSNVGPILNNVVVIASFVAFPFIQQVSDALAITVLAVGTTAGVFVQMACQIPALARHGIHPRLHINLHDPLLRKTVSLGVPTIIATLCTLVTSSVMNSTALAVQPGTGSSVIAYARLWYTLPYALLAVSLNTALYTELARDATRGDDDAVRDGLSRGIAQQFFVLIPFALYLMVFSFPLNMIYCAGKFDLGGVELVSEYLRFLAPSLPLYGVCMLMQKGCSALRNMHPYAAFILAGAVAEIAWSLTFALGLGGGMPFIALSMTASYLVSDIGAFWWMRRRLHGLRVKKILHGVVAGLVLGGLGAAAGAGMLWVLETFVGPLVTYLADGTAQTAGMLQTIAYIAVAGVTSLLVTFIPAIVLKFPEADMFRSILSRVKR